MALAKTWCVDAEHDITRACQCRPRRHRRCLCAQEFAFAEVVLPTVPVAIQNRRHSMLCGGDLRHKHKALHHFARSIVELNRLLKIIASILPCDRLKRRDRWSRRQVTEQCLKPGANLSALCLPRRQAVRHDERRCHDVFLQPFSRCGRVGVHAMLAEDTPRIMNAQNVMKLGITQNKILRMRR